MPPQYVPGLRVVVDVMDLFTYVAAGAPQAEKVGAVS
jgi:hypothetical protein